MQRKKLLIFILFVLMVGCYPSKKNDIIVKNGFILFDNPDYWYFVPVESIDTNNCFQDFKSVKLRKGFQFDPSIISNVSYIQRTLDTLFDKTLESDYLKISPAEMAFSFKQKYFDLYTSSSLDQKWNFNYKTYINNEPIEFAYNIFPVTIHTVRPLFCLSKKAINVQECNCTHKESDPNDYLFKICNYLKSKDRFTDLPCKYNLKSVSNDTLDGKAVTKVTLTCCYLGDVAYFDPITKEILSISYGAK